MKILDMRSDTVSHPTQQMRQAIFEAEVGDDGHGEDPTVEHERVADLIEEQYVSEGEDVLMTLGYEVSNAKYPGKREASQATTDHPKGQAGDENRWCSRDRLDAL